MPKTLVSADMMRSLEHGELRSGHDTALFIETSQILQHSVFEHSPTISQLLIWLLRETLAGKGDSIKSYTIAVGALGRPENFDSQMDSYPRVQIGRLRKLLESYYAQRAPVQDLCVYLQPGSYRLRLAELELAYPQLYHSRYPELPTGHAENTGGTSSQQIGRGVPHRTGMTELPTVVLRVLLVSIVILTVLALLLVI